MVWCWPVLNISALVIVYFLLAQSPVRAEQMLFCWGQTAGRCVFTSVFLTARLCCLKASGPKLNLWCRCLATVHRSGNRAEMANGLNSHQQGWWTSPWPHGEVCLLRLRPDVWMDGSSEKCVLMQVVKKNSRQKVKLMTNDPTLQDCQIPMSHLRVQ